MDDATKLARNNVPKLLQEEGHIPVTLELPIPERIEKLKFMLLDATAKLIDTNSEDEREKTELLSLIRELTDTIMALENISPREVDRITRQRLKQFGSYSNGLVMDGAILNPEMIDAETYQIYMRERVAKLNQSES